jgi:hypothetical protein
LVQAEEAAAGVLEQLERQHAAAMAEVELSTFQHGG